MRSTTDYLKHVVEAADKVAEYIDGYDFDSFSEDSKTQDAVIRQIEIVGEAGKNVLDSSSVFEQEHPDIARDFQAARGMRNVLAHGYFSVDAQVVWNTAFASIPKLRSAVANLLG